VIVVTVMDVRQVDAAIAEEQDYLYRGHHAELQSPVWSDAACRDADPEIFFPISTRDVVHRDEALAHCAVCDIAQDCLDLAMRDRSLVGIWGGTDEFDRARLRGGRHLSVVT
jgi:WhiB family redox-sensing transcriptional regulator